MTAEEERLETLVTLGMDAVRRAGIVLPSIEALERLNATMRERMAQAAQTWTLEVAKALGPRSPDLDEPEGA